MMVSKKLNKNSVLDSLKTLYEDNQSEWVYSNIEKLIEVYGPKINNDEIPLCEKDAILIAYGDSIQKEGQSHLKTLKEFVDDYCLPGINGTHILPFYPYTSDDGFSVTDYFAVDSNLGSWDDISRLSESSNLMFDAVVNHISKSSEWFKSFLAEKEGFQDFFLAVDPKSDVSKVVRPRALPLLTPFTDINGNEKHIWTTFSEDQVDLNYASPQVFIAILEVLLFYVSKGAKYIRLDAIAFLWKEIGTTCIHLEETHLIIQVYRKILDGLGTNTVLITETNVPHEENISYFGNGNNEAHMVYNFTLPPILAYSIHKQDITILSEWANSLHLPGKHTCFFNFTASHDGVGVRPLQGIVADHEIEELAQKATEHGGLVSYRDNGDGTKSPYELNCNYMDLITDPKASDHIRAQRFLLTQSIMLCMPGVPGIYYHSLLGSENDRKGARSSGINRRINREKLDYERLKEDLDHFNSLRSHIFYAYSKLLKIRIGETVFNPYGEAKYHQVGTVFVIERSFGDEKLYAIHNFSDEEGELPAFMSKAIDLRTDELLESDFWIIPSFGFKWLKRYN